MTNNQAQLNHHRPQLSTREKALLREARFLRVSAAQECPSERGCEERNAVRNSEWQEWPMIGICPFHECSRVCPSDNLPSMATGMKDIALCSRGGALGRLFPFRFCSVVGYRSKTQLRVDLIASNEGSSSSSSLARQTSPAVDPILLFPKGCRRGGVGYRRPGVYVDLPTSSRRGLTGVGARDGCMHAQLTARCCGPRRRRQRAQLRCRCPTRWWVRGGRHRRRGELKQASSSQMSPMWANRPIEPPVHIHYHMAVRRMLL